MKSFFANNSCLCDLFRADENNYFVNYADYIYPHFIDCTTTEVLAKLLDLINKLSMKLKQTKCHLTLNSPENGAAVEIKTQQ